MGHLALSVSPESMTLGNSLQSKSECVREIVKVCFHAYSFSFPSPIFSSHSRRMKRDYRTWEECMSLREVKVPKQMVFYFIFHVLSHSPYSLHVPPFCIQFFTFPSFLHPFPTHQSPPLSSPLSSSPLLPTCTVTNEAEACQHYQAP